MSVLTAPRSQAFSRQMTLPFAPIQATKPLRGTGSAGPLQEPAAKTPLALAGEEQSAGTVLRPARPLGGWRRSVATSLGVRDGW